MNPKAYQIRIIQGNPKGLKPTFEKKPLMMEITSVKTWKTPSFHPKPSPSFLYSKEIKVLAAPPLLKGCLAVKKRGEKMKENRKLPVEGFTKYELTGYKVFSWLFYNTKPITNYQTIQLLTLLHEDKLGRNKKIRRQKKVKQMAGNFAS